MAEEKQIKICVECGTELVNKTRKHFWKEYCPNCNIIWNFEAVDAKDVRNR